MNILYIDSILKQRSNIFREETGNATTDRGDKEGLIRMGLGISNEFVDIGFNGLYTALHRWNGIALSLWAVTVTHDGTKMKAGMA